MKEIIKQLSHLLSKHDRKFLLYILIFSIIIALIEIIGISAIMPFMSIANDFSLVQTNQYYQLIYTSFNFSSPINFVIAFGFGLVAFYMFRGAINLWYSYMLSKFSTGRYHLLVNRLLRQYLHMTYRLFVERNSSELHKAIINEATGLIGLISAVLTMTKEIFLISLIYLVMLYVNWEITLALTLFLWVNSLFLLKVISPKIQKLGAERELNQKKFYKILTNSFGGFKAIKLKSNYEDIMQEFYDSSYRFARVNILSQTLSHIPKLYLDLIGFSVIVFIIIYIVFDTNANISYSMAIIAIFVLGLYRLVPSINVLINSYNTILYNKKSLEIVYKDITHIGEQLGNETVDFHKSIVLQNIDFEYIKDKPILKNINLTINKGDSIAFVGESGSGKSTLVDIIIGLYTPAAGKILIDGNTINQDNIKSWRAKIGYIPQSIYLIDDTVAVNVAFGEAINEERVKKVLAKANILDFLQTNQDGIQTLVGEGGVKLSGGQKQRIAIARALYSNPEILVLDEATSALDNKTESQVMDEIYSIGADKTLIIIAHRLSTIDRCNKVYNLENCHLDKNIL